MTLRVYLEVGAKRVFACSVDWPGWCRSGKTAQSALEALAGYAGRYAVVAAAAGLAFPEVNGFDVVEQVAGSTTTDFGAPAAIPEIDCTPLGADGARGHADLVGAAWTVFARIAASTPEVLRKGPRGGGRDRDTMIAHVVEAERAYARKIGVRHGPLRSDDTQAVAALRHGILAVLGAPSDGFPPGGTPKGWPSRYAARRIAWHVLDHAWEMQDRREPG